MSKGINAFWEWMQTKRYGGSWVHGGYIMVSRDTDLIYNPPKQMLEGYMREFLAESGWQYISDEISGGTGWYGETYNDYIGSGPYDYEKVIGEVFK